MMKSILITGGAGFIGSSLAIKLINENFYVRILDNLSPQIHGKDGSSYTYNIIKDKTEFIKGDVRNRQILGKAIEGINIIVHLAAETGTGQSMYEVSKYFNVNVSGTAHLIDLLTNTKHSVKKIIIASSRAVYGEGKYKCEEHGIVYPDQRLESDMRNGDFECKCPVCKKDVQSLPTDEKSVIHPSSYYGLTKQMQEQMVLLAGKTLNIPAIALRYQNVYGPGQSLNNPYTGILSIFSNLILSGKKINIFEDGLQSRDFVYIDDVVEATYSSIVNESINYGIYNVGTGKPINVLEVVEALSSSYGVEIKKVVSGNFRIGDIRHNYADLTKIKNDLGYFPKVNFNEGIRNFSKWVMQQEINDDSYDSYEKSLYEMKKKGLFK